MFVAKFVWDHLWKYKPVLLLLSMLTLKLKKLPVTLPAKYGFAGLLGLLGE